jgi:hypothetical protein
MEELFTEELRRSSRRILMEKKTSVRRFITI